MLGKFRKKRLWWAQIGHKLEGEHFQKKTKSRRNRPPNVKTWAQWGETMPEKKLSEENLKEILDTLYPEYIRSLQRRAGIIPEKENPADLTPEEWQKILALFSNEKKE